MNDFKKQINEDQEFKDLIWINYFENRYFREILAQDKWNELYNGSINSNKIKHSINLDFLNIYFSFSKGNEKFTSKLIKDYFRLAKEKIQENFFFNTESSKQFKNNNNSSNENNFFYDNQLKKINDEISEIFLLEYEKMKQISEVFKDVSLFSQVGWDLSFFTKNDLFNLSKLDELLVNKKEITDLLEKIGKTNNGNIVYKKDTPSFFNEYIDTCLGNNLSKLLTSELSHLHNPLLKKSFYLRYTENRLLNYSMNLNNSENIEKSKQGDGPIIICIDTSSSMHGTPEEIAKSIVMYILKKSISNKKSVYLINFGSINQLHEIDLTNKKDGLFQLLLFLKNSFHGGTDFVTPISRSFELIEEMGFTNSEILFISDGLGDLPKEFLKNLIQKKRENNTKIFTILINTSEIIANFSDEALFYKVKSNIKFSKKITVYDKMGHYEFLDNNT